MRDRLQLQPPSPGWNLEPHDLKFLRDCGIDPEVEEKSVDDEYEEMFNHIAEVRRRKGETP